jgi:hypothetical protein
MEKPMTMTKEEASERVEEIRDEIETLINEARGLVKKHCPDEMPNLSAYVFEQMEEHLHAANRYNSDFGDVAKRILGEEDEDE